MEYALAEPARFARAPVPELLVAVHEATIDAWSRPTPGA